MKSQNKKYRPNVAAVVLSSAYPSKVEFFIGHRSDIKDAWQFPQGGIDEGETPKQALLRELEEEIGTNNVEVIAEYPHWLSYDFPETVASKMYPFDGQQQRYFLVRLKDNRSINIATLEPEFLDYRFVGDEELFSNVSHFKKTIYKKVIGYFKKNGYL